MGARFTDGERAERRVELVALAAPVAAPEWERLEVWLELERAAWVELRLVLLEALYPLAVVTRDLFGGVGSGTVEPAMRAVDVELELARAHDADPRSNYGAY